MFFIKFVIRGGNGKNLLCLFCEKFFLLVKAGEKTLKKKRYYAIIFVIVAKLTATTLRTNFKAQDEVYI